MSDEKLTPERLMAFLDGELPEDEAAEFARLLESHPEWRSEAERLATVIHGANALAYKAPPEGTWDNYWEEIDSRLANRTGWLLVGGGGALVAAYGAWKILTFSQSMWVQSGLVLLLVGLLVLFLGVLRGRILELPKDRYRNIHR